MNNLYLNETVASHIAYLTNHMQCAEISMANPNKHVSYNEHRAKWALAIIRLAEYGIKLPNFDTAVNAWNGGFLCESDKNFALATTRTLEEHIEAAA